MYQPLIQLSSVDVKHVVAQDEDGEATRAIIRCLHDAAAPLTKTLGGSLSRDEHALSSELTEWVAQAERSLRSAWEEQHPGRRLQPG